TEAFRASTEERQFCAIGSVKSNIGHLDAAAGVAGLIKAALALEHRRLPPTLHFNRPNPQIAFGETPFFVNGQLRDWTHPAGPRRAGVSAFGVGGTNVHVILEEARPAAAVAVPAMGQGPQLIVLSARSAPSLAAARRNVAAAFRTEDASSLADAAFSLQIGRRAFDHRLMTVASSREQAAAQLEGAQAANVRTAVCDGSDPAVIFMFPGQGAQYPGMGRDLYRHEQEFRNQIDRCANILRPSMGEDLRALLYPEDDSAAAKSRLMSTIAAQPAIFSVEFALARLLMSWGIKPRALIGHSVGEFVAAVIAGVMSLEDALAIVSARGRLMQELPGGAMLAVRLPEAEVEPLLSPQLAIAAINGPALCVVSGPFAAVDSFDRMLNERGVVSRRLHTSHAFHSPMVDPVVAPLRARVEAIALHAPLIPYVSCVTGDWIGPQEATSADYWARHAREPVRFADGITKIGELPATIFLEVGPGAALSTSAAQLTKGRGLPVVTSMQDATRERDDREILLQAVGRLWTHGVAPDWLALHGGPRRRLPLPTYPFERARYWIDAPQPTGAASIAVPGPQSSSITQDDNSMAESPLPNRTAELSTAIVSIFEELSGERPDADAKTTFLEMGYDSLFLTQVAQKINSQLKAKITFRQLLGELSSISSLADFLARELPASPPGAAAAPAVRNLPPLTPPPAGSVSGGLVPPSAMESLFREQLQAMTQLVNRQFEMLQTVRGAAAPVANLTPAVPVAPTVGVAGSTPAAAAPSRFEVFGPSRQETDLGVQGMQREHLDALVARYTNKTRRSQTFTQDHRPTLADPRAAAGFRSEWKDMVYPIVVASASGSHLTDIDGNDYVDVVNGFGQTALGHSPPFVVEAVKAQLDRGFAIGPQAELAGKVADLFCEMTGNERMTFCNTGSEAVMAAMRIARTVTGRQKIVIFNGDYHGQFDEVLVKGVQRPGGAPRSVPVAPGIPGSSVENMIVLEYGSAQTLQWIRENADELAAVVVEPVQSRHADLRPFDFLRELREITARSGAAFVMDEVVTGFRVHPGGMQAVLGIRADLATYGKILGGGLPIGVLAGTRQYMDALDGGQWRFGDESVPEVGVTFFAGTFVRHPLVLAAAWSVLNHLKQAGPQLQENLTRTTQSLVERLRALFAHHSLNSRIESYSSWFYFHLHNESPLTSLLFYHLRERGIHIQDGFPCFLTTAHTHDDVERIYTAFEQSLAQMQSARIVGPALDGRESLPAGPDQIPLTENQLEIWLSAQSDDDASCAFNESVSLSLRGSLDREVLQAAIDTVIGRHDALRASFGATGEYMQIAAKIALPCPLVDLSAMPEEAAERAYAVLLDEDARKPFDLVNGPCIRVKLVRLSAEVHALILTAHHIVCDGWSLNVIVDELTRIYGALIRGNTPQLAEPLAFSVYARRQARRDRAALANIEKFWLAEFARRPQLLQLPTDRPRPAVKTFNGASLCRKIDADLYQSVKKAGARQGSTLFVTLLAAYQALIGRLADQDEVVVGVPTAGQSLLEDEILVGHCVNFLPIRASWNGDTRIAEFLAAASKRVLDAYEHQDYTFGTLVRKLALPREPGRLPLAEIQFNLERLTDRIELPGMTVDVSPNAKA
ncbi:MAG: aminotransferase class III-fold pyridoxal phosphate-dependent enzyme, partial [Pseudomonadota bacterium]|nr:aminotransferase class III-fold pyridoxal phosphate-dependent enzyme [Pseudomonadota bacterium]